MKPKPVHHYPCTRCHILWPFITTQSSNESLLVSWSPDIRVKHLRYAVGQLLLHAHVGIVILAPEQSNKEMISFREKGWKLHPFFSFANIIILSGGKKKTTKGRSRQAHENNVGHYFKWEHLNCNSHKTKACQDKLIKTPQPLEEGEIQQ